MNWLTNFVKPKLSALVKRKEVPENLWNNCPTCGNMIHHKDLRYGDYTPLYGPILETWWRKL